MRDSLKEKIIKLAFLEELEENLKKSPQLIQVVLGPRQVGKTTSIDLFLKSYRNPYKEVTGDDFRGDPLNWIQQQWQAAVEKGETSLLVIDEVQKIPDWSSHIKNLWDKEQKKKSKLKLVLLGSSALNLQKGLTESLTGRFQIIRVYHWNYYETRQLTNMSLSEFLKFGGYPGSYRLIDNEKAWTSYIQNSIIETVIGKDILMHARIKNPALFKQAFVLLSGLPAQEISYTKLLGQLQDKGNTDLIKYYIELFEAAFLFKIIPKYHPQAIRVRSSSPKIIPLCSALIDRLTYLQVAELGRVFEAVVGARLSQCFPHLYYWRDGDYEVDYVVETPKKLIAFEVKTQKNKSSKSLSEFCKKYPKAKIIFINLENFESFDRDPEKFIDKLI
jgi:predicted AAA+ superfamily ATPase